jgi:uncharacterized membrane protein
MKPLFVLTATFILSCLLFYVITHDVHLFLSGRIAMGIMLVFTSIAHFVFYKGMILMMPEYVPFKKMAVYLTGIMEIIGGVLLLIPATQYIAAVSLIVFFILLLPANVVAAHKKVDIENATYNGNGLTYLWFRIPLQFLFIVWVWYFAILN